MEKTGKAGIASKALALAVGFSCFLLGYVGGMLAVSHAQLYVGGSIGKSSAHLPPSSKECDDCSRHQLDFVSPAALLFAGYEFNKYIAAEVGTGTLSSYRSHNMRTGSDIQQEIDTRMAYVRGLASYPMGRFSPFASLGIARVSMKNHEFGRNDPSLDYVDQLNYDVRTRPLYGVGIRYDANEHVSLRAEVTQVNNVAKSHWTLEQNVTSVWLGILGRF